MLKLKFIITPLLFLLFFLMSTQIAKAATRIWDGGGGVDTNWSTCTNWDGPDICPIAGDTVTFNGTSTNNSTVDAGFGGSIGPFSISAAYTGTITLARDLTITSTFTQSGGTLNASNQTINITTFNLTAGTFRASSGITSVSQAFTVSGTGVFDITTNAGGTVNFNGSSNGGPFTIACNNTTFNKVTFNHSVKSRTVNSDCSLPLSANPTIPFDITLNGTLSGSGTLTVNTSAGFVMNTGSLLSGFSSLQVNLNGGMTMNGGSFSGLTSISVVFPFTINGATVDLTNFTTAAFSNNFILTTGSFTAPTGSMSVGRIFTISPGTTFNANGGTLIFNNNFGAALSCNNVIFNLVKFQHFGSGSRTVGSDCNFPLGANPAANFGGSIVLNGTLTGTGTLATSGTLTLNSGSALSGFNGLSASSLTIAGGTPNFSSYNPFSVSGNLTLSSGTFTAPSTVTLNGTNQTISGGFTFNNLTKNVTSGATLTFPSSTTQTILGTLNLQGSGVGSRLSLRSSTSGTPWRIDAQGGRVLNSLDVKDSTNINSNIMLADSNSIDSGNNTGWSFGNTSISFYLDYPGGNSHITNTNPTYRWKKATPSTNSSITKYELYIQPKDPNTNASIGTPLYIDNIQPSVSNNNGYATYPTYSLHDDGDFLNLLPSSYKLTPGKYNYRVVAHDSAGNVREESLDFYVDPGSSSTTPTNNFVGFVGSPTATLEQTNPETTTPSQEIQNILENINNGVSNLNLPFLSVLISFLTTIAQKVKPIFPLVLLGLLPLIGILTLLTNLGLSGPSFSGNLITKILQALGILPKGNSSGVVYDTKTGSVVPFAVLTLISQSGIIATLITDSKGVYHGVNLAPGVYRMTIKHHEYSFPTKEDRPAIVTVKDFYKGESFSVVSQEEKQFLIVPMDGVGKGMSISKRLLLIFNSVSKLLFVPMLIFSTLVVAANPTPFNIVIAGIYTLIFWYKVLHLFSFATLKGKITDENNNPIPNVIISISNQNNEVTEVTRTNSHGKYRFFSPQDTYQMYVNKEGYISSNEIQSINTKEEKKFNTKLKAFG